jgi:hypothetical protein
MNEDQNWIEALKEIFSLMREIDEIRFIDMWANQVDDPNEEYPFPCPAAFIEVTTPQVDDIGENVQHLTSEVKIYLLYLPTSDTHKMDDNSGDLDAFGDIMKKIYQKLHGKAGQNFSQATRTQGPSREKAQPYEWLYSQTFRTIIQDYSACKEYGEGEANEMTVELGTKPVHQDNTYGVPVG